MRELSKTELDAVSGGHSGSFLSFDGNFNGNFNSGNGSANGAGSGFQNSTQIIQQNTVTSSSGRMKY